LSTICSGGTTTLTANGAAIYTWNPGNLSGSSVTVSPTATQTYIVTGTDLNGCENTAQTTIIVNALPTVNAGANQTICSGAAVTLSGSGASSYSWDNNVQHGVAFTPNATQTYIVTGTDLNGCENTAQTTIIVNALPTVNAGANQTICDGSSLILTGSGGVSYTWTNGVQDGVSFTPSLGSTAYTVTGTDINNCSNTDDVIVMVYPLPIINAGQDRVVCEGDEVTLTGAGGVSYTWDNNVINATTFTPTHTGDLAYILTGTDDNGCSNTDDVIVTVNEHTTATQTETALDSYTWSINNQTYTQSGTYTDVIPNVAGCDSTITLVLSLEFTALEENVNGPLFSAYPNPAQSVIHIKAALILIGECYKIYDNTGRVVLASKIDAENTTVELGNLTGGIYLFSIGENKTQTFKVIKE
jgi:hypothetical protein